MAALLLTRRFEAAAFLPTRVVQLPYCRDCVSESVLFHQRKEHSTPIWTESDLIGMVQTHGSLRVLYESERVIAIEKPHGISHHGSPEFGPGILTYFRHLQTIGDEDLLRTPYTGRVYGVHRLDKVTSGILIFAKDAGTARALGQCFRDKSVVKYYIALSAKKPRKKKQGWVKGDMTRGRRGTWMLKKTVIDPAVTRFFTAGLGGLEKSELDSSDNKIAGVEPRTLLLFRPYTGRTHQLRVAAKSLGLPVLGDPYYGDGTNAAKNLNPQHKCRTYLHAAAIHLQLGEGNKKEDISIWSPPPFDHLWEENGGFTALLVNTMRKQCDCKQLLDNVLDTYIDV